MACARIAGTEVIDNIYEAKNFIEKNNSVIKGLVVDGTIKLGGEEYALQILTGTAVTIEAIIGFVSRRYNEILTLTGLKIINNKFNKFSLSVEEWIAEELQGKMLNRLFGDEIFPLNFDEKQYADGNTNEILALARKLGIPYRIFTSFHDMSDVVLNVLWENATAEEAGAALTDFCCLSALSRQKNEMYSLLKEYVSEKRYIITDFVVSRQKKNRCLL